MDSLNIIIETNYENKYNRKIWNLMWYDDIKMDNSLSKPDPIKIIGLFIIILKVENLN